MLNEILYSTSVQKVLSFLLSHPEERLYDSIFQTLSEPRRKVSLIQAGKCT